MNPSLSSCAALAALLAASSTSLFAQASVKGTWESPVELQIDGVHAALLPTGKVIYLPHRYSPSGLTTAAVFDPLQPGGVLYSALPRNFFCGGHSQLRDGRMLFLGGETSKGAGGLQHTAYFDPWTETWTQLQNLKRRRWYPSAILMGDGRVGAFGGMSEAGDDDPDNTIEYYDPDLGTWALAGGQNIPGQFEEAYNRLHLLPDGKVFQSGHLPQTYLYDPVAKTWAFVDTTNLGKARGDGGSVRLQDGRILIVGGQDTLTIFKSAEIIDLDQPSPQWTSVADMSVQRAFFSTVLLPDGNVLVVGGDETSGGLAWTPELFDPATLTWSQMAPHQVRRGYHSTAIVLPDARVLCSGGEGQKGPGLYEESAEFEIWNPYYLFKSPRPVITSAPAEAGYGQQVQLGYTSSVPVSHVVLHRSGSSTHSFNYNQISVPVDFDSVGAGTVSFTVPNNPNALPPGYYLAFLMNADGVPSVAPFVRIDEPSGPTLTATGLVAGGSATLSVAGATPGGLVAIAYSLTGPGPLQVGLACGSVQIELGLPVLLGAPSADPAGDASIPGIAVPPGISGLPIWFDALDLTDCSSTNGVAAVIG
ncbi:MAG: galactose oxidase-like domain-containing protein [Planctomycetota bacterium]